MLNEKIMKTEIAEEVKVPYAASVISKYETELSERDFCNFLCDEQKKHHDDFRVVVMNTHKEPFMYIITEHPYNQAASRSGWTKQQVEQMSQELLKHPLICAKVRSHTVVWDEDANEAKDFAGDGYTSTLVVDQRTGSCWAFEAGFSYVRLKTMLVLAVPEGRTRSKWERFRVRPDTDVIRLNVDGSLEFDATKMDEIWPFIVYGDAKNRA